MRAIMMWLLCLAAAAASVHTLPRTPSSPLPAASASRREAAGAPPRRLVRRRATAGISAAGDHDAPPPAAAGLSACSALPLALRGGAFGKGKGKSATSGGDDGVFVAWWDSADDPVRACVVWCARAVAFAALATLAFQLGATGLVLCAAPVLTVASDAAAANGGASGAAAKLSGAGLFALMSVMMGAFLAFLGAYPFPLHPHEGRAAARLGGYGR